MNLYLRLFILYIRSFFKPKINDILDVSELDFHVLPNDLDTNGHMNNGRYATIMDLGRMDFVMRNGLMKVMFKQKCVPVLGSVQLRFRIPLMPFQAYKLETKVICWDEKWVFLQQQFIIKKGKKAGAVAAIGIVKGGFYDTRNKQTVPTQDLLDIIGIQTHSPEFPPFILDWVKAEETLKNVTAVQ